jgi:hypothetical protein
LVHGDGPEIVRGRECDCENPDFVPLPICFSLFARFPSLREDTTPHHPAHPIGAPHMA